MELEEVKQSILDRLIAEMESRFDVSERGRQGALEESRAHKGAMESRYDTWKEEAQYLAGAFQAHNEDLRTQLFALKAIKERSPKITAAGVYAVVEVQDVDTDSRTHYFLLPAGGGSVHEFDGMSITVLNLGTPLARAIIGAELDEEFEFKVGAKTRHLCVTAVR